MKRLLAVFVIATGFFNLSLAQVLWLEDFTGLADGTTSDAGATAWTTSYGGTGIFSKQSFFGEEFAINDTDGEGVWTSESIDISAYGYAVIDITVVALANGAGDYIRGYYKIDGGPETQFFEVLGGFFSVTSEASAIVSGSSLEIVVRGSNDGSFFGADTYTFDDVTVSGISTLYSRTSTNWGASGTWSTAGLGGPDCTCTPNNLTNVVVGSGYTVSINAAADAVNVTVQSGGALNITTSATDLNIARGGTITVEAGASLSSGAFTDSQIDYDDDYSNAIVVDGSITIGDFDFNEVGTCTFSGGGAVNVQDDILIDNSVSLINNVTGTFNIADDIIFGTAVTSASVTNNQTMTVAGDLSYQNDSNTFTNNGTCTFSQIIAGMNDDGCVLANSGTLNFSAINTNNANLTINNSGTINQSGDFVAGEIDGGSSYNNLAGGTWNWSLTPNTTYDASVNTIMNCSAAGNTFRYPGAGNQNIITTTYHHLILEGSGTKSTQANLDVNGDLTIQGSAQLDVDTGNDNINLGGNWTVTSSNGDPYVQGAGTEEVIFDGTSDQTVSNSSGETFNRVEVNKSGGSVILNNDITISNGSGAGDLNLVQGLIISSSSALVIVLDDATSASDADSYVDGPIRKIGDDAFTFPTGDGVYWARMGISAPATATTEFTAQYFDGSYGDISNDGSMNDASDNEYWTLDRAVTTDAVRVTLYWEDNVRSQIDDAVSGDLVVARYNGADWTSGGQFSISSAGATGDVTSNIISSFSPITFGSLSSGVNPLPVELISFSAVVKGDKVDLTWETASETNNDYFTIERSSTGESFASIGQVKGNGTTRAKNEYSLTDFNPINGTSYYRLKQTDLDGTFAYSDVISVTYDGPTHMMLKVYPNPSQGDRVTIQIVGETDGTKEIPVTIIDPLGRACARIIIRKNEENGLFEQAVNFESALPQGLYVIKAGPAQTMTQRWVVSK